MSTGDASGGRGVADERRQLTDDHKSKHKQMLTIFHYLQLHILGACVCVCVRRKFAKFALLTNFRIFRKTNFYGHFNT